MPLFLKSESDGSFRCAIKVIPGASRTVIQGERAGELVVKVAAAPEKGKANDELVAFLSKTTGCPKSAFKIISGDHSHHKSLEIPVKAADFLIHYGEKT